MQIRFAAPRDAAQISAIYAHYAHNTAITFAEEAPAPESYAKKAASPRYPFLVAEDNGRIGGFAYADAFRVKDAYRWDVEMTIYLLPGLEGHGTGSRLMEGCLSLLDAQGYLNAYSCITLPNERSCALHRRCGFRELGIFPRTGYKLGRWHDVTWMWKPLAETDAPTEPIPLTALPHSIIAPFLGADGAPFAAS